MNSNVRAWLLQNVQVPIWVVLVGVLMGVVLPSYASRYGHSLIFLVITCQFLRTEGVSPSLAKVNWALRLILGGLWVFGLAWSLYIGK
ncbi:hypothetical protein B9G79_15230 [Bdellovibrio bacteriovorus]|uniref:Uncharacterized protein n=1 Tax=Bdellovibrio bacteriovorus TaxID=959 RepID=A0A1Z3NBJ3_BDEBC|nr:hypothetical protein B9G79_15230 [Bdellovibrio bacteriovorus]